MPWVFLIHHIRNVITGSTNDRIASNIVTGIGFLGAGVIFQSENRINGLTTAATIWITAALGMGIADGFYFIVLISTAIVLISLFLFTQLENWIDKVNQSRIYKIVSFYKENLLKDYETYFREHRLRFNRLKQSKVGNHLTGSWIVQGSEKNHRKFVERIMHDENVKEFEF